MTFNQFTAHMIANKHTVPAAIWQEVRREGLGRVVERQRASRADCELRFDDLIVRIENAVAGA